MFRLCLNTQLTAAYSLQRDIHGRKLMGGNDISNSHKQETNAHSHGPGILQALRRLA